VRRRFSYPIRQLSVQYFRALIQTLGIVKGMKITPRFLLSGDAPRKKSPLRGIGKSARHRQISIVETRVVCPNRRLLNQTRTPQTHQINMKVKPNFFVRVSCGCIASLSLCLSLCLSLPDAHAQSVWTGGTDSVFSTGTNFTPNIANTAVSNLNIQFNGSDATTADLTLAAAFGGGAGGAGSAVSVLTAQTNALTITGSTGAVIRLNSSGLSVESGAGAATLAGTGTLALGGLASPTNHAITNNSGNLLDLGNWAVVAGGGGIRTLAVDGSGNVTSNGAWSGTTVLNKSGAGTLTLGGTNTFSGATTVSGGSLVLTNSLALQNSALDTSGAGVVNVVGPTALTLGGLTGSTSLASVITTGYSGITSLTLNPLSGTQTYSGNITNGAAGMNLVKSGAGIQVLSGSNTYTGTTSASGGRLRLGSADALGSTSKVVVTGGSGGIGATIGNFDLAGFSPSSAIPLELNSGANTNDVGALYNSSSTASTYSGAVELTSSTVIGSGNIELTGGFTGSGFTLNKNGLSTLTITNGGTSSLNQLRANRGNIQVNSGTTLDVSTIEIGTGNSVGAGLSLNGGSVTSAGLSRFGQGSGTASGSLTLNGGTLTVPGLTKGSLTFNANFNGGTLKASADNSSFFQSATIARVQAGGAVIDDGGFAITIGQALVHDTALDTLSVTLDGGLTKLGGGTLTLSGTNTYTGDTSVDDGTLVINGNISTSITNVNDGGTLSGTGTVGALNINDGGTLAIGTSPGALNVSGNLTLALGSISDFEINTFTSGNFDLALAALDGIQTATFNGGTLNLLFQSGFNTAGTVKIFDFDAYAGAGFTTVSTSGLASGFTASFDASNGIVTVVPEPNAAALLGGLSILLLFRRGRS
jgi:autotransporter-associated beta strand protein